MKIIDGIDLQKLSQEANEESKNEQAKEVKRFIVQLNAEIINRTLEVEKLKSRLDSEERKLQECLTRRKAIADGDWSKVPEKAIAATEQKEEKK